MVKISKLRQSHIHCNLIWPTGILDALRKHLLTSTFIHVFVLPHHILDGTHPILPAQIIIISKRTRASRTSSIGLYCRLNSNAHPTYFIIANWFAVGGGA